MRWTTPLSSTEPINWIQRLRRRTRDSPLDSGSRGRLWIEWLAAAALSTSLLIALSTTHATVGIDNALYDWSLTLRHQKPSPQIVIVAVDPKTLRQVGEWPWPRHKMAELIGAIADGHPLALACHFVFLFPSKPEEDKALHDAMARTRTYLGIPHWASTAGPAGRSATPTPEIASAAAGFGAGDAAPDPDGIVRRISLFEGSNQTSPRMVLQMARAAARVPSGGEMMIPFVGPPGSFTTVPAISVLRGQVPKDLFTNKYVLLGATAPELLDNYPTPGRPPTACPASRSTPISSIAC